MHSETTREAAALVGRLLVAALFLIDGWSKVRGYAPAVAYMERFSVPGLLLPFAIAIEVGGGLLLAVGWQTRCAERSAPLTKAQAAPAAKRRAAPAGKRRATPIKTKGAMPYVS